MMVWVAFGMAFYRKDSVFGALTSKRTLVAPSALVQARQRLGRYVVKLVFTSLAEIRNAEVSSPIWHDLTLLGVDGVVWCVQDSRENIELLEPKSDRHSETAHPRVRMVCHTEFTSHLFSNSTKLSEMKLAKQFVDFMQDHSITMFDRGFYSISGQNLTQNDIGSCH